MRTCVYCERELPCHPTEPVSSSTNYHAAVARHRNVPGHAAPYAQDQNRLGKMEFQGVYVVGNETLGRQTAWVRPFEAGVCAGVLDVDINPGHLPGSQSNLECIFLSVGLVAEALRSH